MEQAGPARDEAVSIDSLTSRPPARTLPLLAQALTERFPGALFTRNRRLVEVDPEGRVHRVALDRLSALLQRAVQVRVETKAGDVRWRPVGKDFARWLRADPTAYFSRLRGVRRLPFVNVAGDACRRRGYYPDGAIQLDVDGLGDPSIGRRVLKEVSEAVGVTSPWGLVSLLALLVEPLIRPAVTGSSPCWLVTSPNLGLAGGAARTLATYILGRPPVDHGLPAQEVGLALHIARSIEVDGSLVLLERLPPAWNLSGGDVGRLLRSTSPIDLARAGGRTTIDAGLSTTLAWGPPRRGWRAAEVVPLELDAYFHRPRTFAGLAESRLDVAAALLEFARSRVALPQTPRYPRVPRWDAWSRAVGSILRTAVPRLGFGDEDDVDQWLRSLAARDRGAVDPWARLLRRWPVGGDGRSAPLSAGDVGKLMTQLGVEDLIPRTPAGTDHAAVSALGLLLAARVESGEAVAGLKLGRRKGRNGHTYFPQAVEADA